MFGTSGIRGIYGKEITPQLAFSVGNAIGRIYKKIAIGRDTRTSSPVLASQLASGAMYAGASVIDIGVGPTPLVAFASWKEKCCGAMITASHNPPEYNGIKLFFDGAEFDKQQEKEVENELSKEQSVEWKKIGQLAEADYSGQYLDFLLSKVDTTTIMAKKPKVLVDCGNAAAYQLAPRLLSSAGCIVSTLNCDMPGKFTRNLEPNQSTLKQAAQAVVAEKCDFGIAFDGDGDRAIAIDQEGNVLPLDVQLAIFCRYFLQKAEKNERKVVVSTVEASLCVREIVEKMGGTISITPVGSFFVAQEVKKQQALFGGEPCGEYVFPFALPCADGLLASLFVAEIYAKEGSLGRLASQIKSYHMERRKYKCPQDKKEAIMRRILEKADIEGRATTIDGLRYDFEDGWVLIRPSGTEPAIRLTCEAKTSQRLRQIIQRAEKMIMEEIERQN
ncbi:MAG: phosphoglucosamine mutase [Candidatus Micrarchaeota archaeon]|nr:phosphoglucosamine mutase [Candidatus Micrarchaeota archaeon]